MRREGAWLSPSSRPAVAGPLPSSAAMPLHAVAMQLRSTMLYPCTCHADALRLPCSCHAVVPSSCLFAGRRGPSEAAAHHLLLLGALGFLSSSSSSSSSLLLL